MTRLPGRDTIAPLGSRIRGNDGPRKATPLGSRIRGNDEAGGRS